ncbi:unnamed protein product, partial [Nesidiocoris tenuis]
MNEMPCPPGLIYDDDQSSCAWPTESNRKDCPITSKRGKAGEALLTLCSILDREIPRFSSNSI